MACTLKVAAREESFPSFVNKDTRFIIFAGLLRSLVQSSIGIRCSRTYCMQRLQAQCATEPVMSVLTAVHVYVNKPFTAQPLPYIGLFKRRPYNEHYVPDFQHEGESQRWVQTKTCLSILIHLILAATSVALMSLRVCMCVLQKV